MKTDIAILTIDIPASIVTTYERDVSFAFTEKVSQVGEKRKLHIYENSY